MITTLVEDKALIADNKEPPTMDSTSRHGGPRAEELQTGDSKHWGTARETTTLLPQAPASMTAPERGSQRARPMCLRVLWGSPQARSMGEELGRLCLEAEAWAR
jgi:hypothetical protein